MSIFDEKNKLVKFTGENAGVWQVKQAQKVLEIGSVYMVDKVIKGSFYTYITIVGQKGQFAIEMFEGIPEK